jgi:hypothetical protein
MTDASADTPQPELGPAMLALPNDRWRKFARALASGPQGHGKLVRAYRLSGFHAAPRNAAREAHTMSRDDRVIAAVAEESKKFLRVGHPEAVSALYGMVRDPKHRDHARAVAMVLDRTDPTTQEIHVVKTDMTGAAMIERIKELAKVLGINAEQLLGANSTPQAIKLIEGTATAVVEEPVVEASVAKE